MDTLMDETIPGLSSLIFEWGVSESFPFLE
jgi:hypothetical protein